jgi:hypothetical protein
VAGNKALFQISTKFVNNFVEKLGLDTAQTRQDAGFNKLPVRRAVSKRRKIKDLHAVVQR